MGLACPVCDVPHPDGEHLADHVAITATTRDGDHRAWLAEHAPDWESMTRTELGELVADRAEEIDSLDLHEEVEKHQSQGHTHDGFPEHAASDGPAPLDEEARAIIAEAQKMAERTRKGSDGDDDSAGDSGGDETDG